MEAVWAGARFRNNSDSMPPFPGQRWLHMTQPQEGLGARVVYSAGVMDWTQLSSASLSYLADMSEKIWAGLRVQAITLNGTDGFWKLQDTVHELNPPYKHPHCQLSQEMPDDKMATRPLLGVKAVYDTDFVDLKMQVHFRVTRRIYGINISSLTRRKTCPMKM